MEVTVGVGMALPLGQVDERDLIGGKTELRDQEGAQLALEARAGAIRLMRCAQGVEGIGHGQASPRASSSDS